MKNLIFCSSAFHINNFSHVKREKEYWLCLKQLIRNIPKNFDIVVCDNTIQHKNDLTDVNLKNELNKVKLLILNRNIGTGNIGMGELDELIYTSKNINFFNYDKIVYFTLRKIITNPWIFEQVNKMKKKALLSNPPLLSLSNYNFRYYPINRTLFNDMFFCLTSELMLNYIEYSKKHIEYNLKYNIGSEQNLYKFIHSKNIDYHLLETLGLLRIDYKNNDEIQLI